MQHDQAREDATDTRPVVVWGRMLVLTAILTATTSAAVGSAIAGLAYIDIGEKTTGAVGLLCSLAALALARWLLRALWQRTRAQLRSSTSRSSKHAVWGGVILAHLFIIGVPASIIAKVVAVRSSTRGAADTYSPALPSLRDVQTLVGPQDTRWRRETVGAHDTYAGRRIPVRWRRSVGLPRLAHIAQHLTARSLSATDRALLQILQNARPSSTSHVSVLARDPRTTTQLPARYSHRGRPPEIAAFGDLNGDGIEDVVVWIAGSGKDEALAKDRYIVLTRTEADGKLTEVAAHRLERPPHPNPLP